MIYTYDFLNRIIDITEAQADVRVIDLLSDIREAEASAKGIAYGSIAAASGMESLGSGVSVGVTLALLDDWQIRFAAGSGYIARVSGGNLVGGLAGDPVAYSEGVQVLLIQSAASTVVVPSTGGLSAEQDATLTAALAAAQTASAQATKGRKMQTNKAIISGDGQSVSIYEDDGATLLHSFTVSYDKNIRTPV